MGTEYTLGAMSDLKELTGYIPDDELERFRADNHAIARLVIRGFIPHSQGDAAYKKLSKAINKAAELEAKRVCKQSQENQNDR